MTPRVSVVIPAYNNAKYIRATLQSVLSQDYDDYEVVIADHSSADGTAAVIKEFSHDPRLRILSPTPAGGGAQHNWQRVTDEARGELLKLVCGDDLIDSSLLSRQVQAFDESPELTLCSARRRLIDEDGKTIIASRGVPSRLWGHHPGTEAVRATIRGGTNIFGEPGCVMMRRDALAMIGGWDNTNPYVIDERTCCRVLLVDAEAGRGGFFGSGEALAAFRISSTQWSVRLANSQSDQVAQFHADMLREYPDAVTPSDVRIGNLRARAVAYCRRAVYLGLGFRGVGRRNKVVSHD
ncbi:Glycosyl transferase family 2 [Propionibacterium cyclohexanicum]|uniref:Glycosyl transferase family 2 n=1 Tax=Propionibacterium cyclohexanicum TaxID=64702 RepID=A0A1H9RRJ4_9ACTN|nr:glycosyltransferase family A protein [Propionibacterium cyclohexanicum]SER74539.1 Glycosyl transferase family 2 [Propionibacterium cyclohexanicum]